jgi:hypothetical protein
VGAERAVIRPLVVAALVAAAAAAAHAQPASPPIAPPGAAAPRAPATVLRDANGAAGRGDWQRVAGLVGALDPDALDRADRAEALRLRGLAAFFLGRRDAAEADLLAYLRLDLDARLDPAVTPPEAVTFFDDVRARHAAELRALRPRSRRWGALNLLPPWGQFQNHQRTKGWIIAGTGALLVAADVTSYALLRRWCDPTHKTCDDNGAHVGAARVLRPVNLIAGGALVALYAYGVIDGFANFHRGREVMVVPTSGGGAQVVVVGRF